jgi:hypothetical protein
MADGFETVGLQSTKIPGLSSGIVMLTEFQYIVL